MAFSAETMARAFSNDLRRRVLQAWERENISQAEVARRFGVSYDYVKKIRKHQRRTGQIDRPEQSRHGRMSRVTAAVQEQIRMEVRQQPDATLHEIGERVEKAKGVRLSRSLLWLWLERLGLGRKKNRSRRRSGIRKPTGKSGRSFLPESARSRRKR